MKSTPLILFLLAILLPATVHSIHISNPNHLNFKLSHFTSDEAKKAFNDLNDLDNQVKLIDSSLNQAVLGSK